jgi:hypothetical protein
LKQILTKDRLTIKPATLALTAGQNKYGVDTTGKVSREPLSPVKLPSPNKSQLHQKSRNSINTNKAAVENSPLPKKMRGDDLKKNKNSSSLGNILLKKNIFLPKITEEGLETPGEPVDFRLDYNVFYNDFKGKLKMLGISGQEMSQFLTTYEVSIKKLGEKVHELFLMATKIRDKVCQNIRAHITPEFET